MHPIGRIQPLLIGLNLPDEVEPSDPLPISKPVVGFCSTRSLPSACRRRVAPLVVQIPPSGGGEVTVRGGKAPKSQTTSVKNIENRVLRLRWPAFWAQRYLAWHVARTQTAEYARQPLDTHVNL